MLPKNNQEKDSETEVQQVGGWPRIDLPVPKFIERVDLRLEAFLHKLASGEMWHSNGGDIGVLVMICLQIYSVVVFSTFLVAIYMDEWVTISTRSRHERRSSRNNGIVHSRSDI